MLSRGLGGIKGSHQDQKTTGRAPCSAPSPPSAGRLLDLGFGDSVQQLLEGAAILRLQGLVRRVPVPDQIYTYAARLVRKTRPGGETSPDWLKPLVAWGDGPRAVQNLILGAKARAALYGSYMVRIEDVKAVSSAVLVHRVITTFAAQAERVSAKDIIKRLVDETPDA